MTKTTSISYDTFIVPSGVVSKVDLSRLVHEIEWIDDELTTKSVRAKAGIHKAPQLVLSEQLNDFLHDNGLDLMGMNSRERTQLLQQVRLLKDKAPVIHMTFATAADSESLGKLTAWVRESIHPQAIIAVGLQPALVAGVYLRTPNRVHDFSLRSQLESSHGMLVKEIEALHG